MKKRMAVSLLAGAVLGIVCIIGGSRRAGGFSGNELYLTAMWYNRVIIGLAVGLASGCRLLSWRFQFLFRGMLLGLLISGAFFLSTGLRDVTAFIAGIVYGVLIETAAFFFAEKEPA